jgi:hypothetical membrane protein
MVVPMKTIYQIAGLLCGIIGLGVFTILLIIALLNDPDFKFLESYLSDLGVGPAAFYFNSGLIIVSALSVPCFVFGIWPGMGYSISSSLAIMTICIGCAAGALAGIYTEDTMELHNVFSMAGFIAMTLSIGLFALALRRDHPFGERITHLTEYAFIIEFMVLILLPNPLGEYLLIIVLVVWYLAIVTVRFRQILPGFSSRLEPTG